MKVQQTRFKKQVQKKNETKVTMVGSIGEEQASISIRRIGWCPAACRGRRSETRAFKACKGSGEIGRDIIEHARRALLRMERRKYCVPALYARGCVHRSNVTGVHKEFSCSIFPGWKSRRVRINSFTFHEGTSYQRGELLGVFDR